MSVRCALLARVFFSMKGGGHLSSAGAETGKKKGTVCSHRHPPSGRSGVPASHHVQQKIVRSPRLPAPNRTWRSPAIAYRTSPGDWDRVVIFFKWRGTHVTRGGGASPHSFILHWFFLSLFFLRGPGPATLSPSAPRCRFEERE
ncbi:hypothetical protein OF83DRAFT_256845 [Amylostereum chailletii]|nr:hypothetical protein OF83DRAFT_256845 [Amylostereum chailletii]